MTKEKRLSVGIWSVTLEQIDNWFEFCYYAVHEQRMLAKFESSNKKSGEKMSVSTNNFSSWSTTKIDLVNAMARAYNHCRFLFVKQVLSTSSAEERVQRAGHFVTCLRRELIPNSIPTDLSNFILNRENWVDACELNPSSYRSFNFNYITVPYSELVSMSKEAISKAMDLRNSINMDLLELQHIISSADQTVKEMTSLNHEADQVTEKLCKLLETL